MLKVHPLAGDLTMKRRLDLEDTNFIHSYYMDQFILDGLLGVGLVVDVTGRMT